ncbi:hypothetical protein, conserved [Leishmania tarentolae]|uniref:Uncharacterized protein n=1 Tax=Leishmania tarentolae TaxID=5689 RepID=A0A640KKL1_LEITA|nr:hypothetical protein, conserved [Leishmania tarentolae]
MQLVSDLQQRPKRGRLWIEKSIVPFYDLCTGVQLIMFLIHTVTTIDSASRTFTRHIIVQNDFELAPSLVYKTRNCSFSTVRDIYAFNAVNMTFTQSSVNDVFVDQAIKMRLAIFVCGATIVVGSLNRMLVEANVFVIKFRNFYLWKDMISAAELLLLAYVIQIVATVRSPAILLQDYLRHCGVAANFYLPFVSTINLWVFAGVGYFTYVVGLIIYLNNALPKYGVMTPEEIEEYKAWVRSRRAEQEQVRMLVDEAKRAHARLHMLSNADYKHGDSNALSGLPSVMGPNGPMYRPPYPYDAAFSGYAPSVPLMMSTRTNSHLLESQFLGTDIMQTPAQPGMMAFPMHDNEQLPPLSPSPYDAMRPPGATAAMSSSGAAVPLPVNMPRKRIVPSPNKEGLPMYE